MNRHDKQYIYLRAYLQGAKYHNALKAFDKAKSWHSGLRKDRVTPEFNHQVEICLYLTTLRDIQNEEMVLTLGLLHDLKEDYPEDITMSWLEKEFGWEVAAKCDLLDKNGKESDVYFDKLGADIDASLVKGADRVHNLNSMKSVFPKEKQQQYASEVTKFLKMLKRARNRFPSQALAYFNVEHMLRSQMNLVLADAED